MKRAFLLVVAMVMLTGSGCVPMTKYTATYVVPLTEVERPADARERYGEQTIATFEEEGKTRWSFEDEMVKVSWLPTAKRFLFKLTNKTGHSIKIVWDEAVYVNPNGESQRVMHSGVKYIDRNASQPPTVVVRGATVSDQVFPSDNVYYISGRFGGWRDLPLFPCESHVSAEDLKGKTDEYVGKSVQILLPLQIEDVVNEYIFTFKVQDVITAP